MSRLDDMVRFVTHDRTDHLTIEPEKRRKNIYDRIIDVVTMYEPKVIVKSGLGSGHVLWDLAGSFQGIIVVVEPSLECIKGFLQEHQGDDRLNVIRFINGDFKLFPIDYNKADLLVCIDMFDILETGPVIDEFRRGIQFEGLLFLGLVVLEEKDLEGVYDDFIREIHPLHNDYYLEEDLKTILDLNDFTFIKGTTVKYDEDLDKKIADLSCFYGRPDKEMKDLLETRRDEIASIYSLQGSVIAEPYFTGLFLRRKPK